MPKKKKVGKIREQQEKDYQIYGVRKIDDFPKIDRELPRPLETMVEKGGGCLCLFAPPGSGKCIEENQLIECKEKGKIKIKDVVIGNFINSKNGYVKVIDKIDNGLKDTYILYTHNKLKLVCSLDHKIETTKGMIPMGNIKKEQILTKNGLTTIKSILFYKKTKTLDLEIEHQDHTFYCNDISTSNSNFISNLLLRDDFFKDLFTGGLYIVSPTILNDLTSAHLRDYADFIETDYSEGLAEGLFHMLMDIPTDEKALNCLLFDDCLGSFKQQSIQNKIVSTCRHNRSLVIYSLQAIKGGLPSNIRANMSHTVIFYQPSAKQLADVVELHSLMGGEENFLRCYNEATSVKYGFLLNDFRDMKVYAWGGEEKEPRLLWSRYDDNGNIIKQEKTDLDDIKTNNKSNVNEEIKETD